MTNPESAFVRRYGGIYEHSPWVAAAAEAVIGGDQRLERLAEVMADCVDNASRERQLELIRAHPDLAGKAQIGGELTAASTSEQRSAGLDRCTPEQYDRFQSLNEAYRNKFGFPFVMAVRDSSREEILAAFAARLENDADVFNDTATTEIYTIARLRLCALEEDS
jgi:OHCU decarboxylase